MYAPALTVEQHSGVHVVRDDLLNGGTKTRYLWRLFDGKDEVVYATPAEGGAQTALAHTAARLGKRATIFVAKRKKPHARTLEAYRAGACVFQVPHGYLNVVQSKARRYCQRTGATLAPFGLKLDTSDEDIAAAARLAVKQVGEPDEVWCAAGSGVLSSGLAAAFPKARRYSVQIGRDLAPSEVAGATLIKHSLKFSQRAKTQPPFPSCPHYDAKAWEVCAARHGGGTVLFWNVAGPAKAAGGSYGQAN